MYAKVNLIK